MWIAPTAQHILATPWPSRGRLPKLSLQLHKRPTGNKQKKKICKCVLFASLDNGTYHANNTDLARNLFAIGKSLLANKGQLAELIPSSMAKSSEIKDLR